jgi:arginyl-tRNA--protein-N-Asp/Glu arginylyltransferase
MWEIAFAARANIPHYYLGYWVRDCASMRYKADFRPFELLGPDGVWRAALDAESAGGASDATNARNENWAAPAVEMP